MIRKKAWPFYGTSSGVRLCWELDESKGPKGRDLLPHGILLSSCSLLLSSLELSDAKVYAPYIRARLGTTSLTGFCLTRRHHYFSTCHAWSPVQIRRCLSEKEPGEKRADPSLPPLARKVDTRLPRKGGNSHGARPVY